MENSDRSYYEAIASFQLELGDSDSWNENEFEYYLENYKAHNRSHDLIMLGFIRHLTLLKDEERSYLTKTLSIPDGVQSNWSVKLQSSLEKLWTDSDVDAKPVEITRGSRNRNEMPSFETAVINKIVNNLKKAKKEAEEKTKDFGIDALEFEASVLEFMNNLLEASLDTEIKASKVDRKRIKDGLSSKVSESLSIHTKPIPFTKMSIIDQGSAVAAVENAVVEFLEDWFSSSLVADVRSDLVKIAKEKINELDAIAPKELPESIEKQIAGLVSENEALEINSERMQSRHFVNELDVIDYYIASKLTASYPRYKDFLGALKRHQSAKVIIGGNDERYISLPLGK